LRGTDKIGLRSKNTNAAKNEKTMYFTSTEIQNIDETGLRKFLEKRISEGHHLDYKRALSGSNDRAKREFLKDATGFANANGGDILIGVAEPRDDITVDDQISGVDDGESIAQDLERLVSSSIDPRIPGLMIKPVALQNGKHVIAVHVPPSNVRPFRVDHSGYVNFFIRHRESIFSMTTHEIREAVLSSLSAEARAKEYLTRTEGDIEQYLTKEKPAFLLQAMPLIPPEQPWDVLSAGFLSVIRDSDGKRRQFQNPLDSPVKPTPTIDGIKGRDSRDDPNWVTEVHRNGYISAVDLNPLLEIDLSGEKRSCLSAYHCDLFRSFAHFCVEIFDVTSADTPYVFRCSFLGANGIYLYAKNLGQRFYGPWEKPKIEFPDQIRQVGAELGPIIEGWCSDLFHAFGLEDVV
jgi:Putative DNA-binding domain